MKFKYNVFNFVNAIVFVVAFICLMTSYATHFMYYPTLLLFEAGFVMLSYTLFKSGIAKQAEQDERQEVIVMQLADGEDGETYVMQSDKLNKKAKRRKWSQNIERFMPAIFTIIISVLIMAMLIGSVIKLF